MWKVKTGERAPLWCTFLVFTRSDGQCFVPPIIVDQAKEYSQDLHFNIPLDWTVYHKPSGYMDRYGWLKSMTQLSSICSASPVKNQMILFNGHDSQFDDRAPRHTDCRNIQPFVLKSGYSTKNHPNDNGKMPNCSLSTMR